MRGMRRNRKPTGWMLLVCGLLFTGACEFRVGDARQDDETESEGDDDSHKKKRKEKGRKKRRKNHKPSATPSASEPKNKGHFVYQPGPAKRPDLKTFEPLFKHGRLKSLVAVMGHIALPRDVPVISAECGGPNAFYNPKKHAVVLCYELVRIFYNKFLEGGGDDQKASDQTLNALTFVLLHEMGHAAIGELDLGVTGGEEDAVDDLAALLLLEAEQPRWAVDGALSMALLSQGRKPSYFDEHSLGPQRFYNIVCIVFGSNPKKFMKLVDDKVLPAKRARRCPTEYQRKNKAWTGMLAPYVRKTTEHDD